VTAIGIWAVLVAAGFLKLIAYDDAPGIGREPPLNWPMSSELPTQSNMSTIVMVVHPHCQCSAASLSELAILLSQFQDKVDTDVLFYAPSSKDISWVKTDLWNIAQTIPGVRSIIDKDGLKARLFNASTSGQTMLYDPQGQLVFSGGITSARAHFGDNAGLDSISMFLQGKKPSLTRTSVFGCALFESKNSVIGSS